MYRKKFILVGTTFLILIGTCQHFADSDAEKTALNDLITEIKALNDLIERAEKEADETARIRFRYDWLRRDLKFVRRGIQDHLDAPTTQPRQFEPLQGDYRQ